MKIEKQIHKYILPKHFTSNIILFYFPLKHFLYKISHPSYLIHNISCDSLMKQSYNFDIEKHKKTKLSSGS